MQPNIGKLSSMHKSATSHSRLEKETKSNTVSYYWRERSNVTTEIISDWCSDWTSCLTLYSDHNAETRSSSMDLQFRSVRFFTSRRTHYPHLLPLSCYCNLIIQCLIFFSVSHPQLLSISVCERTLGHLGHTHKQASSQITLATLAMEVT